MSITLAQQAEIARMLGYPNLSPASSLELGYPYYASPMAQWQPYAFLVDRLARTSATEEVAIMGAESTLFGSMFTPAGLSFTLSTASSIVNGATLQMDLSGTLLTITAGTSETPATMALKAAQAVQQNTTTAGQFLANAVGANINLYVRAMGLDGNGIMAMATSSDPSLLVAIPPATASQYAFGSTAGGANPNGPYYVPEDNPQPVYGYVPIIRTLESDLINSRENLDLAKADTYVPRSDEMAARATLWRFYRRQLADRLSVPLDPDIAGNRARLSQRVV
jgi:hypothetical protein